MTNALAVARLLGRTAGLIWTTSRTCTAIVISHRFSTVRLADEIYVLRSRLLPLLGHGLTVSLEALDVHCDRIPGALDGLRHRPTMGDAAR